VPRFLKTFARFVLRGVVVARQRATWYRDEVEVARGSFVSRGAELGHRVRITGAAYVDPCVIGPYTVMARVSIRSVNHHTDFLNMQETVQRRVIGGRSMVKPPERPVRIGAGCWLADNVTVLEGVQIGNGAVVGAGAVVTSDVPAYAIAVGNPARVMRYRYPEEVIELIAPVEWWTWSDEKLRANRDLFEIDLATVDPEVLRKRLSELE
jgi:acetyltransferase-like isoleucine patch superfamily enzyme